MSLKISGVYIMFFAMMVFVTLFMHYVVILWTALNMPKVILNNWVKILPLALSMLFISAMFVGRAYDNVFADMLGRIAYIWLGTLFLWFAAVMCVMLVQLVLAAFKVSIGVKLGPVIFAAVFLISAFSVINAARVPKIKQVGIIQDSRVTAPLTIIQITDSHLGDSVCPKKLKKLFDNIAKENPDIVFFTGDIFERTTRDTQEFIDIIAALNPRLGKYGVLGNHEYYGGVGENLEHWASAGIKPLMNAAAQAGELNVVGINDIRTARVTEEEFVKVIKNSDTNKFTVVMSHTPLYYEEAAENGVNLMLSGHTHAGQIWPFTYLVGLQFKHIYGMYAHPAHPFKHYVGAGTFYWGPPMRFLTNNEVTLIKVIPYESAD